MQTNYEKALEIISLLPSDDLRRLGEWIRMKQNRKKNSDPKSEQAKEEIRKYKLAKKWIA